MAHMKPATQALPAAAPTSLLMCGTRPIRRTLVLPRTSVARGGPVPALVASRRRWALALWLFLLLVADPETQTVKIGQFVGFARAFGLKESNDSVRRTMSRTLATLELLRLVRIVDRRHNHFTIELRSLDGAGGDCQIPTLTDPKAIHIPGRLFSNGWHIRLSLTELAGLLICYCETAWQFRKFTRWGMWTKRRWHIAQDYGIAQSTWSQAKEGLRQHGLLEWHPRSSLEWDLPSTETDDDAVPPNVYQLWTLPLRGDSEAAPRFEAVPIEGLYITSPTTGTRIYVADRRRVEIGYIADRGRVEVHHHREHAAGGGDGAVDPDDLPF
jgi:hypothetical protein